MEEPKRVVYTLEISAFGIHLSRPGEPGKGYDTGEDNEYLDEALKELIVDLRKEWMHNVYQYKATHLK